MVELLPLFSEVLRHTPWVALILLVRTLVVQLRLYRLVGELIDHVRLSVAINRLRDRGASDKQVRRLIEGDHNARAGRSP